MSHRSKRKEALVGAQRAHELFAYDSVNGVLIRKVQRGGELAGSIAGATNAKGYRTVMIDRQRFYVHRVAWLMHHGEWPSQQIDHIDGDKSNNGIANLREASNSDNHQNRGPQSNNSLGLKGVGFYKARGSYTAQITARGRTHFLGYFSSPEKAHEAYAEAAAELHGEFMRTE